MKATIISIFASLLLLGGFYYLINAPVPNAAENNDNVSIVDGTQIIRINAKGGYQPRTSAAMAGLPTVIRFDTSGTFDCSASVTIPSLKIDALLPPSGLTDIDIGESKPGVLAGSCGMGMYHFEIDFQS